MNDKIDWAGRFDRIFCLHYVGHKDRMPGITAELRRTGILDSGVFEFRYTCNDPFEKSIEDTHRKLATLPEQNRAYTSILVNYARVLRESLALGYRRILVLEDDIRFLKDLGELARVVDGTPDADVVQYDKHLADPFWDKNDYREWVKGHLLEGNPDYFRPDGKWFGSSACVAFTARGMKDVLQFMESTYNCPDSSFRACRSYVAAVRQPAVQVMYKDGAIARLYGYNKHSETYLRQGIDLSDYNVPEGYGAEVYDPGADAPVRVEAGQAPVRGRLKVCVYAIARNECKFVDRWMDSMSEADGVYVLDTGSTDGTADRLRARGAHVEVKTYDPWRFDVPRNDSMALCPADTDVYVCTDLDEVLNKGWRKVLEDAWLGYEKAHGARPTRAWYDYVWGWAPDGKTPAVKFRYDKFHDSNYKWVCPVHEVLERRDESRPDRWLDTSGILLEHHPDPAKSRGSYLGLLELAVKERPREARMAFYLAREYSFRRRWDDVIEWCEKYIDMPNGWSAERASAMELLGKAYWTEKGNRDLAELWFRRACDEAPDQREAACTWADLLLADGKADRAVDVLLKTLERTGDKLPPTNHTTRLGCWDASFYNKLGLALWRAGRHDEARVAYRVAVLKYPDNEFLKRQLAACGESGSDRLARLLAASYPEIKKGGSNGMEQKDAHA